MKKITLIFVALIASIASAQTTFDISWAIGSSGGAADLTVLTGDTVRWTWDDALPHTVTNLAGSQENFDSGILTGMGTTFSYTFTMMGTNPYQCDVHPGSMNGVITVDQLVGIDELFRINIIIFPNPATDKLTITSLYQLDTYKIYDVLGKLVSQGAANGNVTDLDVSGLQSGLYFINLASEGLQSTFKITKR